MSGQDVPHAERLERYRVGAYGAMVESDTGPYVRYDDVVALRARVAQLEAAIRWALGEEGEFPGEEPPPLAGKYRRRYHWRKELQQRAALTSSPEAEGAQHG